MTINQPLWMVITNNQLPRLGIWHQERIRCGLMCVFWLLVQGISREGCQELPLQEPCHLLMTWKIESLPHHWITVSWTRTFLLPGHLELFYPCCVIFYFYFSPNLFLSSITFKAYFPLLTGRFKWDDDRDGQLPGAVQKHPDVQSSSDPQAKEAPRALQMQRMWQPGGVSWSRVWRGKTRIPHFILFFWVFFFNEQNERNPIRAKTFSVQIFLVTPAHCIQTSRKSLPKLHNSFFITHGSKNLKQKLKEKKKKEKCHFYPP